MNKLMLILAGVVLLCTASSRAGQNGQKYVQPRSYRGIGEIEGGGGAGAKAGYLEKGLVNSSSGGDGGGSGREGGKEVNFAKAQGGGNDGSHVYGDHGGGVFAGGVVHGKGTEKEVNAGEGLGAGSGGGHVYGNHGEGSVKEDESVRRKTVGEGIYGGSTKSDGAVGNAGKEVKQIIFGVLTSGGSSGQGTGLSGAKGGVQNGGSIDTGHIPGKRPGYGGGHSDFGRPRGKSMSGSGFGFGGGYGSGGGGGYGSGGRGGYGRGYSSPHGNHGD